MQATGPAFVPSFPDTHIYKISEPLKRQNRRYIRLIICKLGNLLQWGDGNRKTIESHRSPVTIHCEASHRGEAAQSLITIHHSLWRRHTSHCGEAAPFTAEIRRSIPCSRML